MTYRLSYIFKKITSLMVKCCLICATVIRMALCCKIATEKVHRDRTMVLIPILFVSENDVHMRTYFLRVRTVVDAN